MSGLRGNSKSRPKGPDAVAVAASGTGGRNGKLPADHLERNSGESHLDDPLLMKRQLVERGPNDAFELILGGLI
jgi:hypothetical protein